MWMETWEVEIMDSKGRRQTRNIIGGDPLGRHHYNEGSSICHPRGTPPFKEKE
jgi:hypothetical protein